MNPDDAARTNGSFSQGKDPVAPRSRRANFARDFHSEHIVRGRRPYYCGFCRTTILMGVPHVHVSSCSCSEFSSYRAHIACFEHASGQPIQQGAMVAAGSHKPEQDGSIPSPASNFPPETSVEVRVS